MRCPWGDMTWRVVRVVEGAALENSAALWKHEIPHPLKLLGIRYGSDIGFQCFLSCFSLLFPAGNRRDLSKSIYMESCPSGRRYSTRKLRCTLEARNPASLEITGHPVWIRYRIPVFSLLLFSPVSSRKSERFVEEYIHGELSEWSKVQHSKCCEESNPPRVQIPDSPPQSSAEAFCRALFALVFR